jgi:hypothetical protein
MKRYAIFSIAHYYPSGGMNDFHKDFDTLQEAVDEWENGLMKDADPLSKVIKDCSWSVEIWDMEENKKVWDMHEEYDKGTIK